MTQVPIEFCRQILIDLKATKHEDDEEINVPVKKLKTEMTSKVEYERKSVAELSEATKQEVV